MTIDFPCKPGTLVWLLDQSLETGKYELILSAIWKYEVFKTHISVSCYINCSLVGNAIEYDTNEFGQKIFLERKKAEAQRDKLNELN